jgi:hypothetical protein
VDEIQRNRLMVGTGVKAQALAKRKSPGVTGLSFQEFPSMESATLARVPPARKWDPPWKIIGALLG